MPLSFRDALQRGKPQKMSPRSEEPEEESRRTRTRSNSTSSSTASSSTTRTGPPPPPPQSARPLSRLVSSSARIPSSSSQRRQNSSHSSTPTTRQRPDRSHSHVSSTPSRLSQALSQRSESKSGALEDSTSPRDRRPSTGQRKPSSTASTRKSAQRPRQQSVAGPSTTMKRFESDRAITSAGGGGGRGGTSTAGSSAAGGTDEGSSKPVWAMGGVFPSKKKKERRRSSVARDWAKAREKDRKELRKERRKRPERTESAITEASSRGGNEEPGDMLEEPEDPFDQFKRRAEEEEAEAEGSDGSEKSNMSRGGSTSGHPVKRQDHESSPPQAEPGSDSTAVIEEPEKEAALDREISPGESTLAEKTRQKDDTLSEYEKGRRDAMNEKNRDDFDDEEDDDEVEDSDEWSQDVNDDSEDTEDSTQNPQVGGKLNQNQEEWKNDLDHPEGPPVRNLWGTVRFVLREPMAEFLGTLMLVVLGIGADCQVKISANTAGDYSSQNWTWGFAVMISVYVAGGISGGHTNPAVTISLAIFRGFPWKMVPRYILAQVFGAFCGALMIYGNYKRALHSYDPYMLIHASADPPLNASATLFITAPAQQVGTTPLGFAQEVLAGGVLMIAVLALGDENNAPPGAGLGAIVLGFVVVAIGMSNGWVSGYAINPARDLGPRLALWAVGYGKKVWTHDDCWWIFGPIFGPLVGSVGGCLAYDLLIFSGPGSPVNWSSHELAASVGIPQMHRMVKYATHPSLRRARRQPERDLEARIAAGPESVIRRAELTGRQRPGRRPSDERKDLEVVQRWRRGKQKAEQQQETNRDKYEEARRKKLERARQDYQERSDAIDEAYAAEENNEEVVDPAR